MNVASTLRLVSASDVNWDAIIVGAGPAGTLAALLLARAGRRILLVERKRFPRAKVCGACLNQHGRALLADAGLGHLPTQLGGIPLTRFHLAGEARSVSLALPGGIAVSRSRLDAALATAAIEAGSEFIDEATAQVLPASPETSTEASAGGMAAPADVRTVRLRRDHHDVLVRAHVVLSADGLGHSSLQGLEGFESQVATDSRIGLGTTILNSPAGYEEGTIYMAVGKSGYAGVVRVEQGALNIAAAIDPHAVRTSTGPSAAVTAILHSAGLPEIADLSAADWHGTIPLTRRPSAVAGHRLLLLGDASGYVEPFTGEGIAWALSAATAVVPVVLRGLSQWSTHIEDDWGRVLRQRIGPRQQLCRQIAWCLRHPWLIRQSVRVLRIAPALARPVVRRLTDSPTTMIGTP